MHGIRHDQARANKGVDLIESPRAPPTEARREHQGRSIDFPRVHHTDLLHVRRYYAAIEFRLPRGVYRLIRRRTQKLWIPWKVSSTKARLNGPVQSHISLNRYSVTSSFDRDIERSGARDCCAIQFRSSDITLWKISRWYYTWIESVGNSPIFLTLILHSEVERAKERNVCVTKSNKDNRNKLNFKIRTRWKERIPFPHIFILSIRVEKKKKEIHDWTRWKVSTRLKKIYSKSMFKHNWNNFNFCIINNRSIDPKIERKIKYI